MFVYQNILCELIVEVSFVPIRLTYLVEPRIKEGVNRLSTESKDLTSCILCDSDRRFEVSEERCVPVKDWPFEGHKRLTGLQR